MGSFVLPEVYHVGYTEINEDEIRRYLKDSGNEAFWSSVEQAKAAGLSTAEILCSFMAKLCYKSLTVGQNANITRTRDVEANLQACFDSGHGSVFEHAGLNFLASNCSRILTHELVRHRVGAAYSQTSGRYVRLDRVDMVLDPILADCQDLVEPHLEDVERLIYRLECRKGLRVPPPGRENVSPLFCYQVGLPVGPGGSVLTAEEAETYRWVPNNAMPFDEKKKLTSAIRRVAPNGQANDIGFTLNIRSVRHVVQMRTAPGAEWEIRFVFARVYELVKQKFPVVFHGAKVEVVDGLPWVRGLQMQPYDSPQS